MHRPIADMKKGPAGPFTTQLSAYGRVSMWSASPLQWILRARGRAQMNARHPRRTPNIAEDLRPSGRLRTAAKADSGVWSDSVAATAVLLGGLLGALLLIVAEFTTLYHVHSAAGSTADQDRRHRREPRLRA